VAAVQYTFTHKQYIERYKANNILNNTTIGECRPCPVLASYALAFVLQPMKKHGKTSVSPFHRTLASCYISASPIHKTQTSCHISASPIHKTQTSCYISASPVHRTLESIHISASPVHRTLKSCYISASSVHRTLASALSQPVQPPVHQSTVTFFQPVHGRQASCHISAVHSIMHNQPSPYEQ
jgi:hypothetical protein